MRSAYERYRKESKEYVATGEQLTAKAIKESERTREAYRALTAAAIQAQQKQAQRNSYRQSLNVLYSGASQLASGLSLAESTRLFSSSTQDLDVDFLSQKSEVATNAASKPIVRHDKPPLEFNGKPAVSQAKPTAPKATTAPHSQELAAPAKAKRETWKEATGHMNKADNIFGPDVYVTTPKHCGDEEDQVFETDLRLDLIDPIKVNPNLVVGLSLSSRTKIVDVSKVTAKGFEHKRVIRGDIEANVAHGQLETAIGTFSAEVKLATTTYEAGRTVNVGTNGVPSLDVLIKGQACLGSVNAHYESTAYCSGPNCYTAVVDAQVASCKAFEVKPKYFDPIMHSLDPDLDFSLTGPKPLLIKAGVVISANTEFVDSNNSWGINDATGQHSFDEVLGYTADAEATGTGRGLAGLRIAPKP